MGRLINNLVERFLEKKFHPDAAELNIALHRTIKENPFRALVSLSGGMFSYDMARAALTIANGRPVLGVLKWIGALIKSAKKKKEDF